MPSEFQWIEINFALLRPAGFGNFHGAGQRLLLAGSIPSSRYLLKTLVERLMILMEMMLEVVIERVGMEVDKVMDDVVDNGGTGGHRG